MDFNINELNEGLNEENKAPNIEEIASMIEKTVRDEMYRTGWKPETNIKKKFIIGKNINFGTADDVQKVKDLVIKKMKVPTYLPPAEGLNLNDPTDQQFIEKYKFNIDKILINMDNQEWYVYLEFNTGGSSPRQGTRDRELLNNPWGKM